MEYRIFRETGIAFMKAIKTDEDIVKVNVPNVNAHIQVFKENGDLKFAVLYFRGGDCTLRFDMYKKFEIVHIFAETIRIIVLTM